MFSSTDINVFGHVFSFTEYDAIGNEVSTTLQMKIPNKNMYLFDIGDGNTLGIKVRPTRGFEYITTSHAIVRNDLSYEEFDIDFDEKDENKSIVTFGRETKYNAVMYTLFASILRYSSYPSRHTSCANTLWFGGSDPSPR